MTPFIYRYSLTDSYRKTGAMRLFEVATAFGVGIYLYNKYTISFPFVLSYLTIVDSAVDLVERRLVEAYVIRSMTLWSLFEGAIAIPVYLTIRFATNFFHENGSNNIARLTLALYLFKRIRIARQVHTAR